MTESNIVVYDDSELRLSLSESIEFENCENANNEDEGKVTIRKKSVSFNKQIVRNVFKPGSTVLGMKKTKSIKNKSAKLKRTVSDPTSNGKKEQDLTDFLVEPKHTLRNRNVSESSDDVTNVLGDSTECLLPNKPNKKNKRKFYKGKLKNKNQPGCVNKDKNSFDGEDEDNENDIKGEKEHSLIFGESFRSFIIKFISFIFNKLRIYKH